MPKQHENVELNLLQTESIDKFVENNYLLSYLSLQRAINNL